MNITYAPTSDAMYIQFNHREIEGTHPVNDLLAIDFAEDGTIVGIELLCVSTYTEGMAAVLAQYGPERTSSK